jgi:AcrR family transcriptional regulator
VKTGDRTGVRTGDDVRRRILEVAGELRARGEPITVRAVCRRLGIPPYQLYKRFPNGIGEILETLEASRKSGEESRYAEAFRLLERGGRPLDLVVRLHLGLEEAEHVYHSYLRLKGVDVGLLRREIEDLKRSNESLERRASELGETVRTLNSELASAYSRGYSDGYGEGYRRGSREGAWEVCDFVVWLLARLYPGLDKYKILNLFQDYYAIYRGEKLVEEAETASGTR